MITNCLNLKNATLVAMLGTLMAAAAAPASGDDAHRSGKTRLQGLWSITVTPTSCTTGLPEIPGLGFEVLNLFIAGGALIETNAGGAGNAAGEPPTFPLKGPPGGGPTERGTGLGTWNHAGQRNYEAVFTFFAHAPDGTAAGTHTIARKISLSRNGNEFAAKAVVVIRDPAGNFLRSFCASEQARRAE